MKFSLRQLMASAGGAVLAAIIASFFGVKGTIIGVAIGSVAATSGTALVAKSIERGHQAVQQVVVRVPTQSSLLRRLGRTGAAGSADHSADPSSPLSEETTNAAVVHDAPVSEASEATTQLAMPEQLATTDVPVTAPTPAPGPTEDHTTAVFPTTAALPITAAGAAATSASAVPAGKSRGIRWPVIAGTAAIIFVLSLAFVTAVELIAGRPLADLFGGHVKGGGTTVQQIITPPPATTTIVVPTTTTSSSTSTTTSTSSTTTSTTDVGTTSSTDNGNGTTTTTGGSSGDTTTTASSSSSGQ